MPHGVALKYLFAGVFPEWNTNSAGAEVFPETHIPPSMLYERQHHKRPIPHGALGANSYMESITGSEGKALAQIIIAEYSKRERAFTAQSSDAGS
jgi:hypothetical protein